LFRPWVGRFGSNRGDNGKVVELGLDVTGEGLYSVMGDGVTARRRWETATATAMVRREGKESVGMEAAVLAFATCNARHPDGLRKPQRNRIMDPTREIETLPEYLSICHVIYTKL